MNVIVPGPLMIDVEGYDLDAEDTELIAHPMVGGVVLFARNYANPDQLRRLVAQMRASRSGDLLIAVDHEGGRVQRFRDGFTAIPAMRRFGYLYEVNPDHAQALLSDAGCLVASELASCDIDFSFAPCVDIDHQLSAAIGDRAFHYSIDGVVALARAAMAGYRSGGMAAVIKHFPGHGSVETDTHLDFACDTRKYAEICNSDMAPFVRLLADASAVMPAHVVYNRVDDLPASLSSVWQRDVLRQQLGFTGAIVSDDLSMQAAKGIAAQSQTALMAINAGTDLALVCNDRVAAIEACQNSDLVVGDAAQVGRRLSLRRKPATQQLTAERRRDIQSRLQLMVDQPAC